METKKKLDRRTKSVEETQFRHEMERTGVIGATTANVGSNCDTMEDSQTQQEKEKAGRKHNGMEMGERTEQPLGERFPLEQPMAKERVLKEYERGDSGVTCWHFSEEDSNSLPV